MEKAASADAGTDHEGGKPCTAGTVTAATPKIVSPESNIGEAMVEAIGSVLESISKMHIQKSYQESAFSAKAPPAISIKSYLKRSACL